MSWTNITSFVLILLGSYVALVVLVFIFSDRMLFFPDKRSFGDCGEAKRLGAVSGVFDYQGEKLRFYRYSNPGAIASVVLFHGNAGSSCDRSFYIEELRELPIDIILAEYPGYSNDDIRPSEERIFKNASALYHYLESQHDKGHRIILYGESLGTGVTIKLASLNETVAGVILQTPYTSIVDLAKFHYPYLPGGLLRKNTFMSQQWAEKVDQEVLILHGTRDNIIPLQNARKLAQFFPRPPRFVEFEGYSHNDLNYMNPAYWSHVKTFIRKLLK